MSKSKRFEVQTPTRWRICFFFASSVPLLIGLFPWVGLLTSKHAANPWSILVCAGFTFLPLLLGFALLFFSLRRVAFSIENRQLQRTTQMLGLSRTKTLEFKTIKMELLSIMHNRRWPRLWLAIYGYRDGSKRMLANEQSCSSVEELFDWFKTQTRVECIDSSNERFGELSP